MRVMMIGPDRSVHGGISGVVNNYFEAGLDKLVNLCYVGTMKDGSRLKKLFTAIKALIVFICKLPGCDIVHVNVASDSSYYRKAIFIRVAKLFHKKIVIHQHGGDFTGFYQNQLSTRGRRRVHKTLNLCDAFLVLAPIWKDFFGTIVDAERITVLPNAIAVPQIAAKQYGTHKLLFLGRLCKEKGIRELIATVAALSIQYPELKLYLGGVWEDADLQKEAERFPKQIIWLGWITGEEKKKYLEESDIFVLPSYFEGQPVSVLEAMAYECACVTTDVGGIPQMIENGKTGILIEPKNRDALKQGLQKVLEDRELCRQLGIAARRKVEHEFSMQTTINLLMDIYRGVL